MNPYQVHSKSASYPYKHVPFGNIRINSKYLSYTYQWMIFFHGRLNNSNEIHGKYIQQGKLSHNFTYFTIIPSSSLHLNKGKCLDVDKNHNFMLVVRSHQLFIIQYSSAFGAFIHKAKIFASFSLHFSLKFTKHPHRILIKNSFASSLLALVFSRNFFCRVHFSFSVFPFCYCSCIYLYTYIFVAVSMWKDFFVISKHENTQNSRTFTWYIRKYWFFSTHFFPYSTTMKENVFFSSCFSLFSFQWKSQQQIQQRKKKTRMEIHFSFVFFTRLLFFILVATWQLGYRKYKGGAIW